MGKTLGQIAYETATNGKELWPDWEFVSLKDQWESVAAAVAAAVKEEDARICEDSCRRPNHYANPDNARFFAAAIRASIKEVK